VAAIVLGAVAIGAVTGVIPGTFSRGEQPQLQQSVVAPIPAGKPDGPPCYTCGTIASIRTIELRQPTATSGQPAEGAASDTASAILRAAGGIFAGEEFEKTLRKRYAYRVTIRMDDGSYRTVSESAPPKFAVGEKVRLVDGTLAASS
jgi:hypothetical protein